MEHYFGAHTIATGGIHMAARRAGNADMRALQLFPQDGGIRKRLESVKEGRPKSREPN